MADGHAGKEADLVLIDLRRHHLQPCYDNLTGIIHNDYPADIDIVSVDGKIVVNEDRVTTVDEGLVLTRAMDRILKYHECEVALSSSS